MAEVRSEVTIDKKEIFHASKNDCIALFLSQTINSNQFFTSHKDSPGKASENTFNGLVSGYSKKLYADKKATSFGIAYSDRSAVKKKYSDTPPQTPKNFNRENVEIAKLKEKYNNLSNSYMELTAETNNLKNENEKLKLLAYKSYDDLKKEMDYEISRATMEKDSLLILMELRENRKLNYLELEDRVTQPIKLFLRLSALFNVNFVALNEKTGYFSITSEGVGFLRKRGL